MIILATVPVMSKSIKNIREECSKWLKTKNKDFPEFIANEDIESKIHSWKNYQRKKITKLLIKVEKCKNSKKREKLKNQIDALNATITDKYIKDNFENIVVNYPRRLENSFLYADDLDVKDDIELDKNPDKQMNKNIFKGLFGGLLLSIAIALLYPVSDVEIDTKTRIITILSQIMVLLMATAGGIKEGLGVVRECIKNNMLVKISIMQKFVRSEYNIDTNNPDEALSKIHLDTESRNLGQNLALQIQSGKIVINNGKLLDNDGNIIAEKRG